MRIKTPPQPLVFRLQGATALCGAVAALYCRWPKAPSSLSLWRGSYYLQVGAALKDRLNVARTAGRYGRCLGPCPAFYAFCREHGAEISAEPVAKLGKALVKGAGGSENGKNCK